MTVGQFITKVSASLVSGAKAVCSAIANASISALCKGIFFVGGSIIVAYYCIKRFTANKKNFDEKKDETPVDRALTFNYEVGDNFKKMNPLISDDVKLNKALKKFRKIHASDPIFQERVKEYKRTHTKDYLDKQEADLNRLTSRIEQMLFPSGDLSDHDCTQEAINSECERMKSIINQFNHDDDLRGISEDRFALVRQLNDCM